jgi:phosphoribosylanthranilate isomerase
MFVKVCGITTVEQIEWASELGYSAVGIVLHQASPRYPGFERARKLTAHARGRLLSVAVGVSHREIAPLREDFDLAQAYGPCRGGAFIYAGTAPPPAEHTGLFLYDASRGSGRAEAFPEWLHDLRGRLIISGGLNPGSVRALIHEFRPYGVDVSSGVEATRGVKDYGMMKEFIEEVRHAAR